MSSALTISTSDSQLLVAGNGSSYTFNYDFVTESPSVISVSYVDATGATTLLSPAQYTLAPNAAATNQLWGVGGTVTYPLSGSAIASGTSLLIARTLPLTQQTSIQNQGNSYPQVIEQALDILEMQIQQVASTVNVITASVALTATSTTSNTIGTGNFAFTVQAGKTFFPGQILIAADSSGARYILGYVVSYSGTNLVIHATSTLGSGTYAAWNISVSGPAGPISSGGSGTVTSVSVTSANGVSGTVATSTTTPAITIALGAITPSSIACSGAITSATAITSTGTITGSRFTSTVATGTAPMTITSTTAVPNLSIGGNAGTVTTNANLTGDVTSVGNATTLATVNSSVGTYANASITVNAKGLITAAAGGSGSVFTPLGIGSFILGNPNFDVAVGATLAAADLRIVNFETYGSGAGQTPSGDTPTGTWQPLQGAFGATYNASNLRCYYIGLFQRVS